MPLAIVFLLCSNTSPGLSMQTTQKCSEPSQYVGSSDMSQLSVDELISCRILSVLSLGSREQGCCLAMRATWLTGPDSHTCVFPVLWNKFLGNRLASFTPAAGCFPIVNSWQALSTKFQNFYYMRARGPICHGERVSTSKMLGNCAYAHTQIQL